MERRATESEPGGARGRGWWRPPVFTAGLALLLALLWMVGQPRYQTGEMRADSAQLRSAAEDRAIVLGSSHGRDLSLAKIGIPGTNFARGGTDAFELDYKAAVLVDRLPRLTDAFVAISYFSFALDNAAYLEAGVQTRVGRRIRLYRAFPHLGFIRGDLSSYLKAHLYPLITEDHWRAVWRPRKTRARRVHDRPREARRARKQPVERDSEWLASNALHRCEEYRGLLENMDAHHPGIEDDARAALTDAIARLTERDVRVTLFIPPFHHTYNDCFPLRYQEDARRLAAEIAVTSGSRFFDFSRTEVISDDDRMFQDADHLNGRGRRRFSRMMAARLADSSPPVGAPPLL